MLPLLSSPDENIKRDTCRTLAEIGDASLVPKIEPLLSDPNKKVQEDARDAIARLKARQK
jgi:HEAT repeat protein